MTYWNYSIPLYLFTAGLSAGAVIVSLAADLIDRERYSAIIRVGAWIAPFSLCIGLAALLFDLERPLYFWRLFTVFRPKSVMSVGAWLLLFYGLTIGIYFVFHHPLLKGVIIVLPSPFRAALFIMAASIALYTGVLMSVLNARPFWNSSIVPVIFISSACLDGAAAIWLYICLFEGSDENLSDIMSFIYRIDIGLLMLFAASLTLFIVLQYNGGIANHLSLNPIFTIHIAGILFWTFVVASGIVVPFIYETKRLYSNTLYKDMTIGNGTRVIAVSILMGGLIFRYIFVYVGQISLAITLKSGF